MRLPLLSTAVFGAALAVQAIAGPVAAQDVRNVVIVHGAFADGSGWRQVSDLLTARGYHVSVVQEPQTSLADDVAATRRILALQDGPVVLVGHSYGGMIISDAGSDDKVAGLVYVAAFQPDRGESLADLAGRRPVVGAPTDGIKATSDGYLYLNPERFHEAFAADLPRADADFLARSQVFTAQAAFSTKAGDPAWRLKPSWAIVATEDQSINPALEREMAARAGSEVREVASSHAVYASQPQAVADVIVEAARQVSR